MKEVTMLIFTMTKEELPVFEDMLPDHVKEHFGLPGYFTTGALDDEGFPIGALQFHIDGDPSKVYIANLEYVYVVPEGRRESIAWQLHKNYMQVLFDAQIPISQADCGENTDEELRAFLIALGYKPLGNGRFLLNSNRP